MTDTRKPDVARSRGAETMSQSEKPDAWAIVDSSRGIVSVDLDRAKLEEAVYAVQHAKLLTADNYSVEPLYRVAPTLGVPETAREQERAVDGLDDQTLSRYASDAYEQHGWQVFVDAGIMAREIQRLRAPRAPEDSGRATPEQRDERFGEEIRRQRDAWREYAEHVDHCVECAQMGDIGDCFERKTLQDATKCVRCGGSARLSPAVDCPICVRSITSRSIVSEQEKR